MALWTCCFPFSIFSIYSFPSALLPAPLPNRNMMYTVELGARFSRQLPLCRKCKSRYVVGSLDPMMQSSEPCRTSCVPYCRLQVPFLIHRIKTWPWLWLVMVREWVWCLSAVSLLQGSMWFRGFNSGSASVVPTSTFRRAERRVRLFGIISGSLVLRDIPKDQVIFGQGERDQKWSQNSLGNQWLLSSVDFVFGELCSFPWLIFTLSLRMLYAT